MSFTIIVNLLQPFQLQSYIMFLRKTICLFTALITVACLSFHAEGKYIPTEENLRSRKEFEQDRFGIFIHWGIYSMFGQGEWYLNYGPNAGEYAKAAKAFYPADFNAAEWVTAIKAAGAKYICFTTRHHDGFSMWHTAQSPYNIVDATPFKRDILKELADECQRQGIKLHLYYSHIDWTRPDYPSGRTGLRTGRDKTKQNWTEYYNFMNRQITELLTQYGSIRAIWFDGWWDHDEDTIPFDWQLPEQYGLVHRLQPGCLIGNNHHQDVMEGEDIQIFERDVPGENNAGYSEQAISRLPLETCQTMNGMWGYKILDQDYKSVKELIHLLVRTAGQGGNLLLNIGPQPNGELPETALERLKEIGEWTKKYGATIYGTQGADFGLQPWGAATIKDSKMYVHLLTPETNDVHIPATLKIKSARMFDSGEKVPFTKLKRGGVVLHIRDIPESMDCIVELEF